MATRFPLYPYNLGKNPAYLYLMEEYYSDSIVQWEIDSLYKQFGKADVNAIIDYGFLIKQRNYRVSLAFVVLGTNANLIRDFANSEFRTIRELLILLPKHTKYSSLILRNLIAFLINFNLIQSFTLPASGQTFFVKEGEERFEKEMDWIYCLSDRLDPHFLYQIDEDGSAEELREILGVPSLT
jgi:hypothetical protein